MGLPILYVYSLTICLLGEEKSKPNPPWFEVTVNLVLNPNTPSGNWRSNLRECAYFAADSLATLVLHALLTWSGGGKALVYMTLSMAFGNGFLCHPLMGFWIMQHLCHTEVCHSAFTQTGARTRANKRTHLPHTA